MFPSPNEDHLDPEIRRQIGDRKELRFQAYSGTDIQAILYLPVNTLNSSTGRTQNAPRFKVFAELQTISISSARSVSPVRVLGRSNPVAYTRGARTWAGTMVFATINKDVFSEIYDVGLGESFVTAASSNIADQMPPFSIVIIAANETGGVAARVIHGITLCNYGTTYSIEDIYTEETYTYVATDVSPLSRNISSAGNGQNNPFSHSYQSVSDFVELELKNAYGTEQSYRDAMFNQLSNQTASARGVERL